MWTALGNRLLLNQFLHKKNVNVLRRGCNQLSYSLSLFNKLSTLQPVSTRMIWNFHLRKSASTKIFKPTYEMPLAS